MEGVGGALHKDPSIHYRRGWKTESGVLGSTSGCKHEMLMSPRHFLDKFPSHPCFDLNFKSIWLKCVSVVKHRLKILSLHHKVITYEQSKHCFWHKLGKITPFALYEILPHTLNLSFLSTQTPESACAFQTLKLDEHDWIKLECEAEVLPVLCSIRHVTKKKIMSVSNFAEFHGSVRSFSPNGFFVILWWNSTKQKKVIFVFIEQQNVTSEM